jgi:hypothetical protein
VHVVPGAHVIVPFFPPPHASVQGVGAPASELPASASSLPASFVPRTGGSQTIVHEPLPMQSTSQPPRGHVTLQLLFPVHDAFVPAPAVKLHIVFPSHVTMPFAPVARLHVEPPLHVETHESPQLPAHCDCPSHVVVQPVPQLTLQEP